MTNQIDRTIAKIVKKLKENYHPQKIILFGSYASGNPQPDSDIDLFVVKESTKRRFERGIECRKILCDENRTQPMDILVYTPQEVKHRLELGDDFIAERKPKNLGMAISNIRLVRKGLYEVVNGENESTHFQPFLEIELFREGGDESSGPVVNVQNVWRNFHLKEVFCDPL